MGRLSEDEGAERERQGRRVEKGKGLQSRRGEEKVEKKREEKRQPVLTGQMALHVGDCSSCCRAVSGGSAAVAH